MKAKDIQKCALCGLGVMHCGLPMFWRVKLQRMGIDATAVRQTAGLEMMMGSVALARAMGPDPDIAKPITDERTIIICEPCAGEQTSIYAIGLKDEDEEAA